MRDIKLVNTILITTPTGFNVILHGNEIARLHHQKLQLTCCNWDTKLSVSRLNVILKALDLSIRTRIRKGILEFTLNDRILSQRNINLNYFR